MIRKVITVLPEFYLSAAAAILLIPFPWLLSWIAAALVHELFHVLAVYGFGYSVRSVKIGAGGAVIETNMDAGWKNGICSLAGPMGGLLMLCLIRIAPRLAMCGAIQSAYNLLPIIPLDGACALQSLLGVFFQNTYVIRIARVVETVIMYTLFFLALYAFMKLQLGIFPVITVLILIWRNKKIPCKRCCLAVQ